MSTPTETAPDKRCTSLHPTATFEGCRLRCYHGTDHEGRHGNGAVTWGGPVATLATLATLQAENAELRADNTEGAKLLARAGGELERSRTEAATLREALELIKRDWAPILDHKGRSACDPHTVASKALAAIPLTEGKVSAPPTPAKETK